jgi:exopolyphosphatase/pppGpp-phosphohydrolase
MKVKLRIELIVFLLFISSVSVNSQNLYGGIEIGSKGIKISVLDIQNAKRAIFESKDFWTENTTLAKGIAKDGNLNLEDIESSCQVVKKNYEKLIDEYKIDRKKIFVIASSGIGMAYNTDLLVTKIKELINVDLEVITPDREARLLIAGGVPPNRYTNSLILDIGGGNTKGGYIDVKNIDNYVFYPLSMRLGTVTLTEKVKLYTQSDDFADFLEWSTVYADLLQQEVKDMFNKRASAKSKKNIYLCGGAVWAFKTLTATSEIESFSEFTIKQVKDYKIQLVFDYGKFEKMALTNPEIAKVIKTYNQQNLLSATNLLLGILENIEDAADKKFYFVKNGQTAWLVAYVLESAKNSKPIY